MQKLKKISKNTNKIFVITGMSGAGKSQALKIFEDFGFFCADNLPLEFLEDFFALHSKGEDIAIGIDVRAGEKLRRFAGDIEKLKAKGLNIKVVFFDATDEILAIRFSETRHRHPLGKDIVNGIKQERHILGDLQALADVIIDTSSTTLGELKEAISRILDIKQSMEMKLSVMSFGFKYGIPRDADMVFDVRFMPNPYYDKKLKHKTGLDPQVGQFILKKNKHVPAFLEKLEDMIAYLIPLFMKEGKAYLTIAIGCTGGKHRSVFTTHHLASTLKAQGFNATEFHKDIKK